MNDDDLARERSINPSVVYRLRTELGESEESIAQMPDAALQQAVLKLEHPDRALRRLEHERAALIDDGGEIEAGALAVAHRQAVELRAQEPPGLTCGLPTGGPVPSARPVPLHVSRVVEGPAIDGAVADPALAGAGPSAGWAEIGPDNIGGRTRSIVIDPGDPDRLYAAGVGGGVWGSRNGGASWSPTDDLMGNLAISCLVINPNDSDRVLAGSGEGFGNVDAVQGDGIFETTDGGDTWIRLASTTSRNDFRFVNTLAYSSDGTVLLAGTTSGILRSVDNGASWQRTFNGRVGNIVTHPTDPLRAIAGTTQGGNALISDDAGSSWAVAAKPTTANRRVQVCYAQADPSVTYASVEATPSQIWRSSDGGASYQRQDALSGGQAASFLGQQGWYDNVIWAGDPTDPDLIVVGGIDLWRSIDGGNQLRQISTWWSDQSIHADHHAIVADPGYNGTTNRRVYFGNDGGVFRTDDIRSVGNNATAPFTNGWVSLNNGYAVTQFYYGAGHVATSTIVGGTQDNGTLRHTPAGGETWNKVYGGDGGACGSDPRDPQIWYGEYVYLNIFRNSNGGESQFATEKISGQFWDGRQWRWKADPYTITDCRNANAQFIAPFVLDPNNADRLLGGARSLWLSTDPLTTNTTVSGPTWHTIKPPIGGSRSHNITAIAVADGSSEIIVVAHGNGAIFRTTNGTSPNPDWDRIDDDIPVSRQGLALAIDPDNHDVIYASFGGYSAANLWKTLDGGQSWTDITGTLPHAPIRAISLHPQRSSWVYLATDVGVFASEDGGMTWSATNQGPADVACRHLFWLGCDLIVATHGRGMFGIDLTIANAFAVPELTFSGSEDVSINGEDFTRYNFSIANADAYPDSLFRPSPDLAPCELNTAASRTWVDVFHGTSNQRIQGFCALSRSSQLQDLWFATARSASPPGSVYVALRDRRCNQSYQSNVVEIENAPDEPEERQVTGVDRRDGDGPIVSVGGPWGQAAVGEVVADIRAGHRSYYVGDGDDRAAVSVVNGRSGPYLRTYGDASVANNLSRLPPIGG